MVDALIVFGFVSVLVVGMGLLVWFALSDEI